MNISLESTEIEQALVSKRVQRVQRVQRDNTIAERANELWWDNPIRNGLLSTFEKASEVEHGLKDMPQVVWQILTRRPSRKTRKILESFQQEPSKPPQIIFALHMPAQMINAVGNYLSDPLGAKAADRHFRYVMNATRVQYGPSRRVPSSRSHTSIHIDRARYFGANPNMSTAPYYPSDSSHLQDISFPGQSVAAGADAHMSQQVSKVRMPAHSALFSSGQLGTGTENSNSSKSGTNHRTLRDAFTPHTSASRHKR